MKASPGAVKGSGTSEGQDDIQAAATGVVASHRSISDAKLPVDHQRPWPQYLVFFEQLEPVLKSVASDVRYKECRRFFNTHFHDDGRRKGDVVVWCMD